MKRPIARPTTAATEDIDAVRVPRAFAPAKVEIVEPEFDASADETLVAPPLRRMGWVGRLPGRLVAFSFPPDWDWPPTG